MSTEVIKKEKKMPERDLVAELLAEVRDLQMKLAAVQQEQVVVKEKKESKRGQPREGTFYSVLAIPTKNFPPQAITCMKILSRAADPTKIPEAEAMRLLEENKNLLGTRQESWRIFAYYRAKLNEGDYLRMS